MDIDHKFFFVVALPFLLAFTGQVHSEESWQLKRLLHPDNEDLTKESKGSVFIYDGLYETDIEFALTNHFHRIESMMFIRTKVVTDGEVEEVDDCS